MKNYAIIQTLLGLFILFSLNCWSQTSFTAEVVEVQRGKEKRYPVYSDGQQYRYDIKEGEKTGAVIVVPNEKRTSILFFEEKYVHNTDPSSMMSAMNDPYQAFKQAKSYYENKDVGRVKIQGFDTEVVELWAQGMKVQTGWYSPELNFLLKLENHMQQNTHMELINIKKQHVDPKLFEVPDDYTEVDEQMRVKIPEPPAPKLWTERKLELPFVGEVNRGERVFFTINYDEYSKFILSNKLDSPSKVVWHIYHDGVKKPEKEQGPDSYRTKRLLAGEHKSLTFNWKRGEKIMLECHEGTMHVEVKPEIKHQ